MMLFHKSEYPFGLVDYGYDTLYLTQDPYIDSREIVSFSGTYTKNIYTAHAIDHQGEDYKIIWEIIDENAEDESDACGWDEYTIKKL